MVITSFYLLNMFPQMRTSSSSPNNQHPTPKPNMFPQMRTLHHHRTINTQHPDKTCSLGCALYIITEQSTPNTQTKHVPSDAHFTSSPNSQHPTPRQNMFPQMRTLHHHPTVNTQHPSVMTVIQQISPSNSLANSSSRSRWSSRIGEIPPMKSVTRFPSFVSTTTGNLPLKDML